MLASPNDDCTGQIKPHPRVLQMTQTTLTFFNMMSPHARDMLLSIMSHIRAEDAVWGLQDTLVPAPTPEIPPDGVLLAWSCPIPPACRVEPPDDDLAYGIFIIER